MTEPWLTGRLAGTHPIIAAVLYALEQARQDLEKWCGDLSTAEFWRTEGDIAPVGFQIRHITGSIDRLMAYAMGRQLSADQLARLDHENDAALSRDEVFAELREVLSRAEEFVAHAHPDRFAEPREVGRRRLPTTLGGLLVHIAEHTQRHVGEAIITAKLAKKAAR
jgi:hypothetical protein